MTARMSRPSDVLREQQVRAEDDEDGEADDEDAVPAEDDVVDRPVAAEPAGE